MRNNLAYLVIFQRKRKFFALIQLFIQLLTFTICIYIAFKYSQVLRGNESNKVETDYISLFKMVS